MSEPEISIREQVMQAVKLRLAGDGTPASKVFRDMVEQIAETDVPCWELSSDEKVSGDGFSDHESANRKMGLKVRAIVEAGSDGTASLDPYYLFAVRKLLDGTLLGNLVSEINEVGTDFINRPDGRELLGMEMSLEVIYATRRDDPAQKG